MTQQSILHAARTLHADITSDVWPNGATLQCKACDHTQHATAQDCARYLANGWPRHCGQPMTLAEPETGN
jgi:hypothetical protein